MAQKRFLKGLFKDTAPIDQPEGTWRYANNIIINDKKGSISNEGGNQSVGSFNIGSVIIGIIEVSDDRVVIFYINTAGNSEIGIWENGIFTILYAPVSSFGDKVDLKFNRNYPIEGTFNINPKGELLVYWTDDLNPPRVLNVDLQKTSFPVYLYSIDPANSHDNHITLLNLFPNAGPVPHVDLLEITLGPSTYQNATKEGGGLLTGVYYLSLAYVDDSYTATNFLTMSNPISIVDEGDHTRPTTKKDGATESSQTSKSITWNITNMNTDYKFIRPVIVRKMGAAVDAFRLNDLEIPSSSIADNINIVFSGIEGFTPTSLEDVIIDTVSYETVKTINQLDGILYLGNTTAVEDLGYQKYANNIKLTAVTKTFENFDENILTADNLHTGFKSEPVDQMGSSNTPEVIDHSKSYRYIPNIFKYKGYMRDEVYAFYIAFILNDGSMSYAYHIPGRESTGNDLDELVSSSWWKDFRELSPSFIRKYHLYDYSTRTTPQYSYNNRNMNYWHNSTELYPTTDNFEVWDQTGDTNDDLKGLNVRHHHFPSNGNPVHKTIHESTSEVTESKGIEFSVGAWSSPHTGSSNPAGDGMTVWYVGTGSSVFNLDCQVWKIEKFSTGTGTHQYYNPTSMGSTSIPPGMHQALWKSHKYFVADQPMHVSCKWKIRMDIDNGPGSKHAKGKIQLVKEVGGVITTVNQDTWDYSINYPGTPTSPVIVGKYSYWSTTQYLDIGDRMYLRSWKESECGYNATRADCSSAASFIEFRVTTDQTEFEPEDVSDVKLSHTVKALGFKLDDIKIPQSIANKIQGFRIYRAKRKQEDKRILGQSIMLPMFPNDVSLGICEETYGNSDAQQIMSSALARRESIYSKDSYPRSKSTYPHFPLINNSTPNYPYTSTLIDRRSYKAFSFHDFNLLRTQNSLAGATHIKPQYKVYNFVWNGASLNQPKKMVSKIIEDDGGGSYSEPIKKIEQFWGWDTEFNCYSKWIYSALFVGCHYKSSGSLGYNDINTNNIYDQLSGPRLLGQKAKTYIPGDSIFEASALGFGGKIFNEFGESSIVFSLEDRHEIFTDRLMSKNAGLSASGLSDLHLASYDRHNRNAPFILLNPSIGNPNFDIYNLAVGSDNEYNSRRSQLMMANLHSFKTDVYKSIDNQELVWTGFEVLGDDLNNFTFDDDTGVGSTYYPGGSINNGRLADYKTSTILSEGIFGGDTYICRYGFRSTIQRNNTDQESEPRRAIHYQIVESTDNINFRHSESDKDLYFPGSIARRMLQSPGEDDFTHQDNLNYDDSFSAENDLRPAFPLPLKEIEQTDFPTRAHRSVKRDTTSLTDNYRIFLANEFRDIPKNRGELWKLSTFNNLLYFHMEESLYVTKGKQQMQMKDGSEAFVGSGDIFAQEPDEIMQADKGYGGTQSQWAALTTNYGYFFVDVNSRKVFLMQDKLNEISTAGLENWFKDNLPFTLDQFSYGSNCISQVFDNPIVGLGLTAIYDPKFKRILLTKKDLKPTTTFITGYNKYITYITSESAFAEYEGGEIFFKCDLGQYVSVVVDEVPSGEPQTYTYIPLEWDNTNYFTKIGWTISYYPEFNVWCGFHDYTPYIYFNTSENFYSFTENSIYVWEHNSDTRGSFYGTLYPFEFEYIHNEFREEDALFASFNYTLETFNEDNINVLEHGFTSFFIYNTLQLSGESDLEYLVNIRRVGNNWKVNNFRDMAAIAENTSNYYMLGTVTNPNIIGGVNTGTITTSSIESMFTVNGTSEIINTNYINTNKEWQERKKFIDKWAGIRLIYNNQSNNLLNLYSAAAAVRKTYK